MHLPCLSASPSRRWGLQVGGGTRLAAWPAASCAEASPNADKLEPTPTPRHGGRLGVSFQCLSWFQEDSYQCAGRGGQCREPQPAQGCGQPPVTWRPLLAQPFPSWGHAGGDFPHPWPQLPPLVPSYLLPGCVEEEIREQKRKSLESGEVCSLQKRPILMLNPCPAPQLPHPYPTLIPDSATQGAPSISSSCG